MERGYLGKYPVYILDRTRRTEYGQGMGVHQLREGEHASLFYDRPAELLESLIPAVRQALSSGEQCIYLADEITAAHVASALGATMDVSEALDRRALRLVTERVSFCPTG